MTQSQSVKWAYFLFTICLQFSACLFGDNEGDIVFDPYMESGSHGKAAIENGRRFIGIELDEGYFNIAQNRIEEASNKTK